MDILFSAVLLLLIKRDYRSTATFSFYDWCQFNFSKFLEV
uniref:Uncharacterized protein n=1 Tax=Rhizophora mucronata TaxID=61149 RepID=A0A2P2P4Y1_RHIMU